MTDSDWIKKAILLWICVANSFYRGTHARRYEKCLTPDGHQGVCVVKRYCREASNVPLIPCDSDDSFCCPIPTAPLSEQPFRAEPNPPPKSESVATSLDPNIRPSIYPLVDENKNVDKDGRLRAHVSSFNRQTGNESSRSTNHHQEQISNPVVYDYFPVGPVINGHNRTDTPRPQIQTVHVPLPDANRNFSVTSGHRPRAPDDQIFEDTHRLLQNHRPTNSRPSGGYEEEFRRPINGNHTPKVPDEKRVKDIHRPIQNRPKIPRPVDGYEEEELRRPFTSDGSQTRPQTFAHDTQHETLANRNSSFIGPSSTGKVRFEDEKELSHDDRQLPKHATQRPTVDTQGDRNRKNKEHSTTKPRHEIPSRKEIYEHVREDAERGVRGRPPSRIPSHYPSKDTMEFPERRKPVRNSNIEVPAGSTDNKDVPIKFPEGHEFQASQPKVPACGVKPYELFIAGGETSKAHEWPWMTAIFRRHQSSRPKTFLCGGSLINTKYILTAAHCFVNNYVILPASSFVVQLGSHHLSSGEEYTVSNLVIHHNHSGSDFFNDIALVRLASEVYVTDKIAPICLPFPGLMNENLVGRIATVSGWGDTAFRTGASRELQHVAVPIVSGEECFAAYSRVRGAAFLARGSDHVICAGLREGGKDACLGDSGGPLMLKSPDDSWVIVGIVSLGYKCAEPGYPGVYTRVTHYIEWIQTNMKSYR